jgi:5,10-methylenetetrahydromethanopterin reductase
VKVGFGLLNNLNIRESVEMAQRADQLAYDSVWFAEHNFSRDAVTICAAASATTERIRIGSCVVPIFTRSALLLATTFASLDELSRGRIILGLGAGSRQLIKAQGLNYEKPVSALREYVAACRTVWRAHGTVVSYSGNLVRLDDAELDFEPIRKEIPIYIGATGPRACEMSAEIGDGVLLNSFLGVDYVDRTMGLLRSGAERGGKSLDGWDVGMMLVTCLADSKREARAYLRPLVAVYLARLPDIANQTSAGGDLWTHLADAVAKGGPDAGARLVSDELIDEVTINGTMSDVRTGLERYIAAGINLPIITPVGFEGRVLEAMAPSRLGPVDLIPR